MPPRRGSDAVNHIGERFGRLIVVRRVDNIGIYVAWECLCDCGASHIAKTNSLMGGSVASCGCLRKERVAELGRRDKLKDPRRRMLDGYKYNASRRGYAFELTDKQFFKLTDKDCYYCGAKPTERTYVLSGSKESRPYVVNGIDRKDNGIGYTVRNCVPCCSSCNNRKKTMTVRKFREKQNVKLTDSREED